MSEKKGCPKNWIRMNGECRPKDPMPGDLLRVTSTDDVLIKKGSYGVIEGKHGRRSILYSVCFNPSPLPWWWHGVISSSGGPVRTIEVEHMKPTKQTKKQRFQYFPGLPAAHTAKTEERTVKVFNINLKKVK